MCPLLACSSCVVVSTTTVTTIRSKEATIKTAKSLKMSAKSTQLLYNFHTKTTVHRDRLLIFWSLYVERFHCTVKHLYIKTTPLQRPPSPCPLGGLYREVPPLYTRAPLHENHLYNRPLVLDHSNCPLHQLNYVCTSNFHIRTTFCGYLGGSQRHVPQYVLV